MVLMNPELTGCPNPWQYCQPRGEIPAHYFVKPWSTNLDLAMNEVVNRATALGWSVLIAKAPDKKVQSGENRYTVTFSRDDYPFVTLPGVGASYFLEDAIVQAAIAAHQALQNHLAMLDKGKKIGAALGMRPKKE